MRNNFMYDSRLGISIPDPPYGEDTYTGEEWEDFVLQWEGIKGTIPDRIKEIETIIHTKQNQLSQESNFELSCHINSEIADFASIINDLWLWYRKDIKAIKLHL
ncbi:hypothetical protein [Peribacillus deserti]|uniref:Radical SAM protein n=1 Tax=Peribacillus deserti TaxID=673318 RepID=A0A2N5M0D4_9BACI|nr:hypothetical protein [Peribacillus deserti]PLT27837.1 hypothetical protein CUU66_21855 [Peribacillus deserti]